MTMKQIQRAMYRAQAQPGQTAAALAHFQHQAQTFKLGLAPGDLMTISLFQWRGHFFAYWESIEDVVTPEALFGDMGELLASWPGADQTRSFAPMMDIFHCLAPESVAHWRRKQPKQRTAVTKKFSKFFAKNDAIDATESHRLFRLVLSLFIGSFAFSFF